MTTLYTLNQTYVCTCAGCCGTSRVCWPLWEDPCNIVMLCTTCFAFFAASVISLGIEIKSIQKKGG